MNLAEHALETINQIRKYNTYLLLLYLLDALLHLVKALHLVAALYLVEALHLVDALHLVADLS